MQMRIGRQAYTTSAISTATADTITVRGKDLCDELIGKTDFTSYFWLLVTGQAPTEDQRFFADAVLVSIAEHGLVPSVVAARMTLAAAPEAFHGAVAAGLLGCGSVVLGSAETTARFLQDLIASADRGGLSDEDAARRLVQTLKEQGKSVPGFGHSLHTKADPRADRLLALAAERNVAGRHIRMLHAVQRILPEILHKTLAINVNGAIPAVMLDVGFPAAAMKGISLLARTASLVGHLQEETERPIGFLLSHKGSAAIGYEATTTQTEDSEIR